MLRDAHGGLCTQMVRFSRYTVVGRGGIRCILSGQVGIETYRKEVDVCDYSLEAYQSRPAAIGEKLTLGRFPSGSMGFASGQACDLAVCVPADAKLRLEGIGEATQKE